MTAHKGSQKQGSVYRSSARVKRAYKGSTLVYTRKVQTSANKLFNTAGTFSFALPAELLSLTVRVVGAGGGAGGDSFYHGNCWGGAAGASGGMAVKTYNAAEIAALKGKTVSVVVGAAGAAQAGTAVPVLNNGTTSYRGVNGGASKFNGNIVANGGAGGYTGVEYIHLKLGEAAGGTASGGTTNTTGNASSGNTAGASLWNGYGKGGPSGGWNGAKEAGTVGCVYIEYTYLKAVE